jgi:hypothetical protein
MTKIDPEIILSPVLNRASRGACPWYRGDSVAALHGVVLLCAAEDENDFAPVLLGFNTMKDPPESVTRGIASSDEASNPMRRRRSTP